MAEKTPGPRRLRSGQALDSARDDRERIISACLHCRALLGWADEDVCPYVVRGGLGVRGRGHPRHTATQATAG